MKVGQRQSHSGRFDLVRLKEAMMLLIANDQALGPEWLDHALKGAWADHQECHTDASLELTVTANLNCQFTMSDSTTPTPLTTLATRIAATLRERGQTVSVIEGSAGGLVSAALLSVPGASAYFVGGAVVYTRKAGKELLGLTADDMAGMRAETEPYAQMVAGKIRDKLGTTWGLSESGASGPSGSSYGDLPGHVCVAVVGPTSITRTIETGLSDRSVNMDLFARALLTLFDEALH